MGTVFADISTSLDGYVAGPDPTVEEPLGRGGEQLHEWAVALASWRRPHGREGGETGLDDDVMAATQARTAAVVMGRNMFGGGPGPWGEPAWNGWWGEEPPFHAPVFVLTHHPREPLEMQGGTTFTFVCDGIAAAVEQARGAADDGDVLVAGGASTVNQALAAGLLDELHLHVAPVLLGAGERLFEGLGEPPRLTLEGTLGESGRVSHLRYRVER
ncbi:dihydrofolate reductase family protein [Conexibacter arvalis]|uniref:Dihydrofolate reductase n=1 Tax=Conexibacter arvalis TaxID=912552 RepID=A0A840IFM3_9ACTN|nr:dihydrofolate reductase family protein [Conexibacter arvalis]MBB4662788.1 dihydrofolate reductase [Conexibacter arvalis]